MFVDSTLFAKETHAIIVIVQSLITHHTTFGMMSHKHKQCILNWMDRHMFCQNLKKTMGMQLLLMLRLVVAQIG